MVGAVSVVTWLSQADSQSQAAATAAAEAAAVLEGFGTKASSSSHQLHASRFLRMHSELNFVGKPENEEKKEWQKES